MINMQKWNVEEIGYTPVTTFWEDFYIAEQYGGINAVKDTFNRAFREWKSNYKYLTELVMVLNHKIAWYYNKDMSLAKVYYDLYNKANDYAWDNLTGEERNYFHRITD